MIEKSRKVQIRVRQMDSTFHKINSSHLPPGPERLGESRRSTSILKSDNKLMELVMPELLSISANSPKWDERLTEYFGSLTVHITNTKTLETGHKYTLSDPSRLTAINAIRKKVVAIKSDKDLAEYIEENIPYNQRFEYASPINKEDYIVYRVALEHGHVANKIELMESSPRIRFYLYTDAERMNAQKREAASMRTLITAQSTVMADDELLENILWAYTGVKALGDIDKMAEDKRLIELGRIAKDAPTWLIDMSKDKNIDLIATIRKYVSADVIHKLPGSETFVDGANRENALGNSMADVIRYFKDAKNAQVINSYAVKYKALVQ